MTTIALKVTTRDELVREFMRRGLGNSVQAAEWVDAATESIRGGGAVQWPAPSPAGYARRFLNLSNARPS